PTFVSALSLLLGYCYESDKNPVEAFTINEAFEDIPLTIIHQHTPPTKRHAERFMTLSLGPPEKRTGSHTRRR
ncbi:MAG: hypothetical protein WBS14_09420, partial [Rhodomicrobium sp.]